VKTHLQAERDPQVEHIKAIGSYEHPVAGSVKVVAPAVKMSATPAEIRKPAPLVGQHSREILSEFGYGAEEIERLIGTGTVGETPAK
jgi:crotonobetainyl-CoA:carnitine CoA-transferase CaiB-like acyl-CoA transferase